MTPRSLKLWRSRLRTLKHDLELALGAEKAEPLQRAVDRIGDRLASEAMAVESAQSAQSVDRRFAVGE